MRKNLNLLIASVSLFAALGMPVVSFAQEQKEEKNEKVEHHHFKLVDIGTFGGPNNGQLFPNPKGLVNNSGVAVGGADTSTPDPTGTFDPNLVYGFEWRDGVLHKLGALPGFNSSFAFSVSDSGHVVGVSENGIDPLTGGRALEAVLGGKTVPSPIWGR